MNGRNGIAQLMLQAGTDPNAKDWEGETALLKFSRQVYGGGTGQAELIKLFIAKGADLDVRDKDGHSSLYYAIDHNQVAASRLLISAGADATSIVRKISQSGEVASVGAFEMAVSSGAHDVALWLVKDGHAADMMFTHTALKGTKAMSLTPIYAALTQGWEDVGIALVEFDSDKSLIDAKNKDGATPLHIAAMKNHEKAVAALIEAGANVNARNQHGETALFRAADRGHRNVVLQLIKGGANVEAKDRGDNTALFKAAAKGHAAAASALLEHGADKNAMGYATGKAGGEQAKMASMETPAQCADRHGFKELAQYIRDFKVVDRDL
jgi:ankyrin repeat protein